MIEADVKVGMMYYWPYRNVEKIRTITRVGTDGFVFLLDGEASKFNTHGFRLFVRDVNNGSIIVLHKPIMKRI